MLFEESVDSLRTYLSLSSHAQEHRIIAVCSAVSGEGKTSLAAQLAVCIARATREPTLLIDGDLRSPDVHDVFELQQSPGLAEVLQQDESLEESIDTSFSERLHILTAGRLRTNPHRLLGSGDFESIVERLKTTYRYIIIDTPPVLPASESLVFARSADTTILCMRRDFSRLDQSKAALSRMAAAGIHISGAVLNGIPSRQYAYRYGTYNYEVSV
jgi:capsular exopolysaccharide synthesis family protein